MLTWLPLRATNICQFKVGSLETGANLFKAKLSLLASPDKPEWVVELLESNPDAEIWQVHFRDTQTKNYQPLYCILPRDLVSPLEEFLTNFRPLLCKRNDCEALFPSKSGKYLEKTALHQIIRGITFRYYGKLVNPHLIRDIGVVGLLKQHHSNPYTASRWLGHMQLETTNGFYASMYNLSDALREVEQLREMRKKLKEASPAQSRSSDERPGTAISLARQLLDLLRGLPGQEQL
jgi:hypothetical protein